MIASPSWWMIEVTANSLPSCTLFQTNLAEYFRSYHERAVHYCVERNFLAAKTSRMDSQL